MLNFMAGSRECIRKSGCLLVPYWDGAHVVFFSLFTSLGRSLLFKCELLSVGPRFIFVIENHHFFDRDLCLLVLVLSISQRRCLQGISGCESRCDFRRARLGMGRLAEVANLFFLEVALSAKPSIHIILLWQFTLRVLLGRDGFLGLFSTQCVVVISSWSLMSNVFMRRSKSSSCGLVISFADLIAESRVVIDLASVD